MDRLINNESVIICAVLNTMILDVNQIAKIYLYVVLSVDRATRKRLPGYASYEEFVTRESSYYQALNRKFVEFQPVFLNAMTMLVIGGMVENKGEQQYDLTEDGARMAFDLQGQADAVLDEVKQAVAYLDSILGHKAVDVIYKDLKIVL